MDCGGRPVHLDSCLHHLLDCVKWATYLTLLYANKMDIKIVHKSQGCYMRYTNTYIDFMITKSANIDQEFRTMPCL